MTRTQIKNEWDVLQHIVEYLNNIASQLVDRFHSRSNKIRYIHNTVLGKKCSITQLMNISTVQYSFDQLVMALRESVQLQRKIVRAGSSSKTYHGQFTYYSKVVCKYENNHRYSRGSRNYRSSLCGDSHGFKRRLDRDRSHSRNGFGGVLLR